MKLRPYQEDGKDRIRASIAAGNRRVLAVSPTGSGKTVLFADIASAASAKHQSVLIVAHRREIIKQTSDKLTAYGCGHGILMAGHHRSLMTKVQVASLQTFSARILSGRQEPPPANLIIFDEAHRSISPSFRKIADLYPGAVLLGLTATPIRGDGRGLGSLYQDLIEITDIRSLIDEGFLVEPHVFAPSLPDLSAAKVRAGDYAEDDLDQIMNQPVLVGNIVRDWHERAGGRPTIVFASSVAHSRHIRNEFEAAGVRAAHIDGTTDNDIRDQILSDFANGEIDVVTNCQVLTEGWDAPIASCCVLARPTKSYGLYLQMVGRVLRPHESKEDALIIDHAGNVYEHGFPEDAGDWDLDEDTPIEERRRERLAKQGSPTTCRNCFHVYDHRRDCPLCGWMPTPKAEAVNMQEGRLHKVEKRTRKKSDISDEERYWNNCLYRCANSSKRLTMNQVRGMFRARYPQANPKSFQRTPGDPREWSMTAKEFIESRRTA